MVIRYDPSLDPNPFRARRAVMIEPAAAKRRAKVPAEKPAEAETDDLITARQIRAARGLLNWTQAELAQAAGVGRATLARIEADMTNPGADTLRALRRALIEAGVRLYDDSDGIGEGARMAKPESEA